LAVNRGPPFGTLGTDATPEACKPIDAVMAAPADLVEVSLTSCAKSFA
jgi:hypothetical protein